MFQRAKSLQRLTTASSSRLPSRSTTMWTSCSSASSRKSGSSCRTRSARKIWCANAHRGESTGARGPLPASRWRGCWARCGVAIANPKAARTCTSFNTKSARALKRLCWVFFINLTRFEGRWSRTFQEKKL